MLRLKTPLIRRIKSDRINVLRKQYDAFLEEDKKRKDRNDYILGRLDKMRYSSMAVKLRHPPNNYADHFAPSYNRHGNRPETQERNDMQMVHVNQHIPRPNYHSQQMDVPRNFIEESSILKEISKKYILIPKLRSTFPNDGLEAIPPPTPATISSEKPSDIDNNDWKSKYDILEQLKNTEKDEEFIKYSNKNDQFDNKEPLRHNILDRTNNNEHITQNYTREELPTRYEEEIPEKDVSDQLFVEHGLESLEKCTINENIEKIPTADVTHMPSALSLDPEVTTPYYEQKQNEVVDQHVPEVGPIIQENMEHYTQPEQNVVPAEQNVEATSYVDNNNYQENYPDQEFQAQQEQEYPIEYEQFIPNAEGDTNQTDHDKVFNQEENDYSPIEVINPNELVEEINKNVSEQEAIQAGNMYPTEVANSQEFAPNEEVVFQDGQGIDPEHYMVDDGTIVQGNPEPQMSKDEPTDNSGIEEFDAEQREMFYSEQTDPDYTYDNQGAAGDAYNAEYVQNQDYPQNQEYAYYEGAQQEEGAYPVEINEHEETQELYDQHYEQQFANTNYEQGYEQQNVYMEQDPSQPQFEQPALYDEAQQQLEQNTFQPQPTETLAQVEESLDREDGYIEKRTQDPPHEDKKSAEHNVP